MNKLEWYRPRIVDHIIKSPDAGQLSLSPGSFKWFNRDEKKAELSKARVDAFREREKNLLGRCQVDYDGDVLTMLVGMGQILDAETDDAKEVGKAISGMLAEAAQHWKAEH